MYEERGSHYLKELPAAQAVPATPNHAPPAARDGDTLVLDFDDLLDYELESVMRRKEMWQRGTMPAVTYGVSCTVEW